MRQTRTYSAQDYVARGPLGANLQDLQRSTERVEQGVTLSPELDQALLHGSSIGGARPKPKIPASQRGA